MSWPLFLVLLVHKVCPIESRTLLKLREEKVRLSRHSSCLHMQIRTDIILGNFSLYVLTSRVVNGFIIFNNAQLWLCILCFHVVSEPVINSLKLIYISKLYCLNYATFVFNNLYV